MTYSGNTKEKLSETSRKYVLCVAYWRFFFNALLVLCDMTAFIIASAIVYVVRNAGDLYSTRFHFYLALWVYTLVGSLIWIYCLHSVGVYHRHVMGDGYQLNAFLVKGAIFAGLMVCALNSIEHALEFLSKKSQLNYHVVAVCPIGLNEKNGLV